MENHVRLYTIDNEIIPNHFVTDNPSFFIRSFQKFAIKLNDLSEDSKTKIYSVVEDETPIDPTKPYIISEGVTFPVTQNSSYTIFFDKAQTLSFDVSGVDGFVKNYVIQYIPENSHDKQLLFDDLIHNHHLPSLEELLPCILNDVNRKDILQRMLLDFQRIVNTKGTKKTIEKFFAFIGFGNSSQFHIFDEYISTITGTPVTTITPNKSRDTKSGDYWVIYDNYETEDNPYDKHNLPNRKLDIQDLEEFWIKLERAIALANIYFILPEQSINRFTLNNSVNIPSFLSLASKTGINFSQNVHKFEEKLHIYIWSNLTTSTSVKYFVSNNLMKFNEFGNTQLKYYISDSFLPRPSNKELFVIEKQIYDDEIDNGEEEFEYVSTFGCVMRMVINEINPYEDIWCEYTIQNVDNPLTQIFKKKFLMTEKIDLTYVSTLLGNYKITIDFFDGSNNRERYTYNYSVTQTSSILDFNVFSSVIIMENKLNSLDLDISSPSEVTVSTENRVLSLTDVPFDLLNYFNVTPTENPQYLLVNDLFVTPKINKNFPMDKSTSIPVDFMDTFLDLHTFKYNNNLTLKLRVLDTETGDLKILDYNDADAYETIPDELFITTMDIADRETMIETPYIFITTRVVGLEVSKVIYDLILVDNNDEENIISIYDLKNVDFNGFDFDYNNKQIPLNFDIPLFHRESSISDVVTHHPEETTTAKSIYPRLLDMADAELNVNNIGYSVLLGDVFVCRIDELYITNMIDVTWEVVNAFTNEVMYTTRDFALKYRVEDLIVFDVVLTMRIKGGGIYRLNKKSLFTAYKLNL